jgi:hypothetical protein
MSIQDNNTKRTDLINDNTKRIDRVLHHVDELATEIRINSLTLPKSDESASDISEKINTNHLFIVDGQECICLEDTLPTEPKNNSEPHE